MESLGAVNTPEAFGPGTSRVWNPAWSRTKDRDASIRTDIEGLRAVAILLVVAFHVGVPGITGGFIGVDVFYVLSGCLITGMLVKEIQVHSRLNLLQFYARRMRRLLPASMLVLIATLGAAILLLSPQEMEFAARGARASALYMSNAFFATAAGDYFSSRVATNPLLHTWSLSVEEQFYVFWPIVILLGLQVCKSMRVLTLTIIGLTAASLAASILLAHNHHTFAFYMLPSRAWEFGIGALAVLVPPNMITRRMPTWPGLTLILASAVFLSPAAAFPGWIALIPVIGTVLTLLPGASAAAGTSAAAGAGATAKANAPAQATAADRSRLRASALLATPSMQWLGRHSYSWYLWHWPLLVIVAIVLPNTGIVGKLGAVAASLVLAVLTHHYFENPIRFNNELVKRPVATLVGGVAFAALGVMAATYTLHFAARLGELPQIVATTRAARDIATLPRRECISEDGEEELKVCTFGDPKGNTVVVLFGDSHTIPWTEPMRTMADRHGWKLLSILKSGCSAADYSVEPNPVLADQCSRWRARAIARIRETRPSVVFVGSATNRLIRHADPGKRASAELTKAIQRGTREVLLALPDSNLILIRDNPEFAFDMPSCLARTARHAWYTKSSCEMPLDAVLDPAVAAAEKAATTGVNNVRYLDFTDRYCSNGRCSGIRGGLVMYRDADHLTSRFAASLESALEPEVLATLTQRERARSALSWFPVPRD